MNIPQTGEIYSHFKTGNIYEILGTAKYSETLEDVVIYKALYGEGLVWVRPTHMFSDIKTLEDGTQVQRFTKVN